MKIGIITQPLCTNYGGILQNFALQTQLIRLGHTPITIDLVTHLNMSRWDYLKEATKLLIRNIIKGEKIRLLKYQQKRPNVFNSFVRSHILTTECVSKYSDDILDIYDIQCVIVGSDQVWRPIYNVYPLDMYLKFCSTRKITKLSYAASFGVDKWEYSSDLTEQCRELIKHFKRVSVRELSGVSLCRSYLNCIAEKVLDPTLLLDKVDYLALCKNVPICGENYIAVYALGISSKNKKIINSYSKSHNIKVKYFTSDTNFTLSVEEWIAMFRDANYVITDSYHGTVFSVIFNKDFISISHNSRGAARFISLLEELNLADRLVDSEKLDLSRLNKHILWTQINGIKELLKSNSIAFLKNIQ